MIARAVRSLRKRLGLNQADFAARIGCQQNTISRYERSHLRPSFLSLMKLLQEAEKAGADYEAGVFMEQLRAENVTLVGGVKSFEELLGKWRPLVDAKVLAFQMLDLIPEFKRFEFGFRQFVAAVALVIDRCETVGTPITRLLQLYATYSGSPQAEETFAKAASFAEVQLFERGGGDG